MCIGGGGDMSKERLVRKRGRQERPAGLRWFSAISYKTKRQRVQRWPFSSLLLYLAYL